ncbi:MAG: zinc-binding dehydrogenase [Actinomycetota bacterium]|nr:zinc-binding dehydrogenase [Actinomycetota bacterium]
MWAQTGAGEKVAFIEDQGADRILVGEAQDLREPLAELQPTAVFDPLGGDFVAVAVEALAPRGRLVSFGTSAGPQVSFNMQTLYRNMLTVLGYGGMHLDAREHRAGLQAALGALAAGELRVSIDEVLPLAAVGEALGRLERRQAQGKLLLEL